MDPRLTDLLPPAEWDFRKFKKEEYYAATFYELARSAPEKHKALCRWFDQPFKKLLEAFEHYSGSRERYAFLEKKAKTVREAIYYAHSNLKLTALVADLRDGGDEATSGEFSSLLWLICEPAFGTGILNFIASHDWHFPSPRMKIRIGSQGDLLYKNFPTGPKALPPAVLFCPKYGKVSVREDQEKNYREVKLLVDPRRSPQDLQEDFMQAIRPLGEPKASEQGRPVRPTFLKHLAAYRLHAAGIVWTEKLKNDMEALRTEASTAEGGDLIPVFASNQRWMEAVKKTQRLLQSNFLDEIDEAFHT